MRGVGGRSELTTITAKTLEGALTGDPEALGVHLALVERDVLVEGRSVRIHCHCLSVDGNGRIQVRRLAEFMRNAVVDYAIPRTRIAEARARDARFQTTEATAGLLEEAKRSFTDLARTGEGGEMLLFLLAERFLGLPQILCKMHLKTDERLHYNGADGVYAGVTDEGVLKLYWGESKIYEHAGDAIRACLDSLAPYLVEPEHEEAQRERDLVLLGDKADLTDPAMTAALRRYFDKASPQSKRVRYCGVALVGFEAAIYPEEGVEGVADEIADAARLGLVDWSAAIDRRLTASRLERLEIEFLCIPLPSAQGFRNAFLDALGVRR